MFSTFGLLEPNNDLQIAYFGCVIARYFVSFFYDHPVEDAGWISPPHSNIIQELTQLGFIEIKFKSLLSIIYVNNDENM